jgi:hypothetical protein
VNAMIRRLRRLEDRVALVDTEEVRRGRERVETLGRRIAAAQARGEWRGSLGDNQAPDTVRSEHEDLSGLTLVEVLRHGRARALVRVDLS